MTHISMKRVAYCGSRRLNHSRLMTSPTQKSPVMRLVIVTPAYVGSSPRSSHMEDTTCVGTLTCVPNENDVHNLEQEAARPVPPNGKIDVQYG